MRKTLYLRKPTASPEKKAGKADDSIPKVDEIVVLGPRSVNVPHYGACWFHSVVFPAFSPNLKYQIAAAITQAFCDEMAMNVAKYCKQVGWFALGAS